MAVAIATAFTAKQSAAVSLAPAAGEAAPSHPTGCTCIHCIAGHSHVGAAGPGEGTGEEEGTGEAEAALFQFSDSRRFSSSAITGSGTSLGDPITMTWGFVRDGTGISNQGVPATESTDNSSLIAMLDNGFSVPQQDRVDDLTDRPWFAIFEESFDRFAQLSGLSYVYEPNDDGVVNGVQNFSSRIDSNTPGGVSGVRADFRIGGHSIDGGGASVVAYNWFPPNGEMVLDTDNASTYSSDNITFRNILMHEHGHGLGIAHVEPRNGTKLMEPFISTAFEGPQIDDIQAIHRGYGDVYEKSNSGAGNDSFNFATPLGAVVNTTVSIGVDGGETGSAFEVTPDEVDFISIDDNSDVDYLSFTLTGLSEVDLLLTPVGGQYASRVQDSNATNDFLNSPITDFTARSNLSLTLFDTDGTTPLAFENSGGLGDAEAVSGMTLDAGTYFVRVLGGNNTVQLYQLDVTASLIPEPSALALAWLAGAGIAACRGRG
ncbi:MAG: matrixin family metalloprotease [Planctomycetota bacterium]